MDDSELTVAERVAKAATDFQINQTGHAPSRVSVVMSEDTLVITMHEALSPAERALTQSPEGMANLREFHRELFRNSATALQTEIENITGRKVREAAAELDPGTGSVIHAFTTGTAVQVFLFSDRIPFENFGDVTSTRPW